MTATDASTGTATHASHRAPTVKSVNVGMPKGVAWQGKTIYTGIWKHPVHGSVMARRLNLDGDGQGDLNGHGGEQRAVLVYQIGSYRHWARHFRRDDFGYGQFGENLTVDGLSDDDVCIGDRYRIGEAEFEVTQPRVTCYRVGLRLGEPELPILKTRTGPGALSVAETDALLYLPGRDPAKLRLALQIPALSPGWQGSFRELAEAYGGPDTAAADTEPADTEPAWAGFRKLRVTEVVQESASVSSIHLIAADGTRLPAAKAGQYLTVRVPSRTAQQAPC